MSRASRVPYFLTLFLLCFFISAFCFQSPARAGCGDPENGLVGWWKLDDGSGTNAVDSSGSGNTGTLNGGPTWGAGKISGALNFDGTDDYITGGTIANNGTYTISMWVKTPGSAGTMTLFLTGSHQIDLYGGCGTGGDVLFDEGNCASAIASNAMVEDNQWHNLVVVATGGTSFSLYVDGVFQSSGTGSADTSPFTLEIGQSSFDSNFFNGVLDDVRIYNRALSATEVKDLYNAGYAGDMIFNGDERVMQYCDGGNWVAVGHSLAPMNGLVGWWKLDDGSGTNAADSSGNGNTGTLQNSPTWTSGIDDGALKFVSASSQYVNVSDAPSLNLSRSWTESAWVNLNSLPASGKRWKILTRAATGSNENYALSVENATGTCASLGWRANFNDPGGTGVGTCYLASISAGTWYFVTGVYDAGAQNLYLYVNGALVSTQSTAGYTPDSASNATGLWIAGQSGQTRYVDGTIDDVRVYNRALSASEVSDLYLATGGTATGDITTGLIGWWKLDDGSGSTAKDSSGDNNNGTLENSPLWTSGGKINGALRLDGTNDVKVSGLLGTPAAVTLSAWANLTAPDVSGAEAVTIGDAVGLRLDNVFATGGVTGFYQTSSGYWDVISTGTYVAGTGWHDYAYVVNPASSSETLYIDGVSAGTSNNSTAIVYTGGTDTYIGKHGSGSPDFDFNGTIDDVRIYDRALSATDIAALYNERACANPAGWEGTMIYNKDYHAAQFCDGKNWQAMGPQLAGAGGAGCSNPAGAEGTMIYNADYHAVQYCDGTRWVRIGHAPTAPEGGLAGWWKFDEGGGTSAADSSGQGNTGTLVNGPTWTTSGKINAALTFNGSTQGVTAADAATLRPASWTAAAWVNVAGLPAAGNRSKIINKDGGGANTNYGVGVDNNSCGGIAWRAVFDDSGGGNHQLCNVTTINTGTWYHVAGTFDSTSKDMNLYVNGILVATRNFAPNTPDTGSGHQLGIGFQGGSNANYFNGTVDDARVYNRALSASEVWDLYLATGGT